jgi:hypothetical protein
MRRLTCPDCGGVRRCERDCPGLIEPDEPVTVEWKLAADGWYIEVAFGLVDHKHPLNRWSWALMSMGATPADELILAAGAAPSFQDARRTATRELKRALRGEYDACRDATARMIRETLGGMGGPVR